MCYRSCIPWVTDHHSSSCVILCRLLGTSSVLSSCSMLWLGPPSGFGDHFFRLRVCVIYLDHRQNRGLKVTFFLYGLLQRVISHYRKFRPTLQCERVGIPSESRRKIWWDGESLRIFRGKDHRINRQAFRADVPYDLLIQDEQLYVSDSRALQSILVKEHDAFEETSVFLE